FRAALGLLSESVDEVGMNVALPQHAGPLGGDAEQIPGARLIDFGEGAEDRGDEDGTAIVGLGPLFQQCRIGLYGPPLTILFLAEIAAQRVAAARCQSELLRQLSQDALAREIAAGACDLVSEDARIREMLEQRNDVGKSFVEGEHILVDRLVETWVYAVEQRVRRFMRNNVVRKTREDRGARRIPSILCPSWEVPEEQCFFRRAVERVLLTERVRIDAQSRDIVLVIPPVFRSVAVR